MKSIVGSILIITFSEIVSLIVFVLISGTAEQSHIAWFFSTIILGAMLVYVWIFVFSMSIKQVLLISIFVPLLIILFYWFMSFVWFQGLAKDISFLSRQHIVATLYLLITLIPIHMIVLLILRRLKMAYGRVKN